MNKKQHIRVAVTEDMEAINAIYNQAIDVSATADMEHISSEQRLVWFQNHESGEYPVYVFEREGEICGWLSFSPYRPGRSALRKTAEVSCFIDSQYRKQGIGKTLINFSIAKAPELGFKNLFAILLDNNAASIRLMEACGFSRWAHLPNIADFKGTICGQYYYGINL